MTKTARDARRDSAVLACGRGAGRGRQHAPAGRRRDPVLHVQGNVYMLAGPGGNTTVQAGDSGVLIVDTQAASQADKLLAAIRTISPEADPLHRQHERPRRGGIGGNAALAKAGPDPTGRRPAPGRPRRQRRRDDHHHRPRERAQPHDRPTVPIEGRPIAWPSETFFGDDTEIFFNGEAGADPPPACRPHRRRQHRVLPAVGRHRHRRHLHDDGVPVHRCARGAAASTASSPR